MDGFKLYVTNTSTIPPVGYLCYEDPDPGLPKITQTIPCHQLGKYVIYYDIKKDDNEGPVIELCYVAINGCRKGMWGIDCSTTCPSICIGQHCHPENGSCVWGCGEQKCLNNRWDIQTGACTEGCAREHSQFCNCNKYNLTPYGTATQISDFQESLPQNAIEPPISNTFSKTLCSHTDLGSEPAWWMFHFSFGLAYITDINIYYRENFAVRMDGFKVYVTNTSTIPPNGHLCHEDGPGLPITTQTIPCNQLGQYVIYYDTKGSVQDRKSFGPIIELCYVAINGTFIVIV
ncbi:Hypothetical predicted protein [Mytilus galloprovincialis]|uniref:Fucolectin tachylectin-4 pentraxin-1 domain-containing protein n=1 Tax=Mytilus galloprovincialis TaxID=29158 RepID=A0A8B6HUN4_MYTGA|nr:Hypothetical predicted protein [Mytilus galloprovincialis]